MSRSKWASTGGCEPVSVAACGVGELPEHGDRPRLRRGSLIGAASSANRLIRLVVASMLVIGAAPAPALAGSVSGSSATSSSTPGKQQSAHPDVVGAVVMALRTGYSSRYGSARVRALQRRLARAGYAPGPIDGLYGPRTLQAVNGFQATHGLEVDGIAGPLTLAALSRPSVVPYPGTGYAARRSALVRALQRDLARAGYSSRDGSSRVRALQRRLAQAGYAPGPIDGLYGPRTQEAVSGFQAAHGLAVDGIAGAQTFAELGNLQPTSYQAIRPPRPGGSDPPINRSSRPASARKVVPATHTTGSPPVGLIALLIALAAALGFYGIWLAHRRRDKRHAIADAAGNGASSSDAADAIAQLDQTTTLSTDSGPSSSDPADVIAHPDQTTAPNADSGPPDDADSAFRHAVLLEEHGDQKGAMAAYERADGLGHAAAAANLGVLLEQQGDRTAAEAAYRRADQRGSANGTFNLATLLEEEGDLAGAMAAYERADRVGHGTAAANLGVLLEQQGDRAAAEAAYQRADQRDDASGTFNLAILLEEEGDHIGALRAYRRAEQLGHPAIEDMARAAALELTRQINSPIAVGTGDDHDVP